MRGYYPSQASLKPTLSAKRSYLSLKEREGNRGGAPSSASPLEGEVGFPRFAIANRPWKAGRGVSGLSLSAVRAK
jgi:hypothetical protein